MTPPEYWIVKCGVYRLVSVEADGGAMGLALRDAVTEEITFISNDQWAATTKVQNHGQSLAAVAAALDPFTLHDL